MCNTKKEIIRLRKGLQNKESIDGSCVRSYVIVPRCSWAGLIMITRLVRKYCYVKKVSSTTLSPDGI